jgi:hypothetical protein
MVFAIQEDRMKSPPRMTWERPDAEKESPESRPLPTLRGNPAPATRNHIEFTG